MANISSYNQLSSWNEDDDLLFVQQPDAPKKAHPSQMKEYILEGLDVSSVGGVGKYISAISETDGKIAATAETMDEAPTEGSSKAVTSGGIKTAIDDSVSLKTATGNPITLTDAANANAEELSMTIEPIQSGSGDPSPTNVRPISGLTSGEVQTTNGTDTNTATITLGQTVYGGSVNFKTGEVTVTHGMVDLGTLSWNYNASDAIFIADMPSDSPVPTVDAGSLQNAICEAYVNYAKNYVSYGDFKTKNGVFWANSASLSSTKKIFIRNTAYTDAAAFKTAMSGVQLCYELDTPTTLTLTPAELELLKGNNTITANGAEISIKYYPDNAIGTLAGRVDDAQEQITGLDTRVTALEEAGGGVTDFVQIVNTASSIVDSGTFTAGLHKNFLPNYSEFMIVAYCEDDSVAVPPPIMLNRKLMQRVIDNSNSFSVTNGTITFSIKPQANVPINYVNAELSGITTTDKRYYIEFYGRAIQ